MKYTNAQDGWMIRNGSGWNHHLTADSLESMLQDNPDDLPAVPDGYIVLVAPISDKPFGLRCALVRVAARRMDPFINFHVSEGNYVLADARTQAMIAVREADDSTAEECRATLLNNGYFPTDNRPKGWPDGFDWFRHYDGTWASIEMLDNGPDGDISCWAYDQFGVDVEIVHSVKCEQQSDDDREWFIKKMREAIVALTQ